MHLVPALLGLVTGLTLIVAIGAQNAFVLRTGIAGRTRVVATVVVICAVSDALLIFAGVIGVGALVEATPVALIVIRIVGSAFLIGYGLMAARRVLRPGALVPADPDDAADRHETPGSAPVRTAALTALALTWLNPHVYLDTIVFLGSVANQQGPDERWWWASGALLASCLWFAGLGFGARLLRPVFARPAAWRILDGFIAVVMIALGLRLAFGF